MSSKTSQLPDSDSWAVSVWSSERGDPLQLLRSITRPPPAPFATAKHLASLTCLGERGEGERDNRLSFHRLQTPPPPSWLRQNPHLATRRARRKTSGRKGAPQVHDGNPEHARCVGYHQGGERNNTGGRGSGAASEERRFGWRRNRHHTGVRPRDGERGDELHLAGERERAGPNQQSSSARPMSWERGSPTRLRPLCTQTPTSTCRITLRPSLSPSGSLRNSRSYPPTVG